MRHNSENTSGYKACTKKGYLKLLLISLKIHIFQRPTKLTRIFLKMLLASHSLVKYKKLIKKKKSPFLNWFQWQSILSHKYIQLILQLFSIKHWLHMVLTSRSKVQILNNICLWIVVSLSHSNSNQKAAGTPAQLYQHYWSLRVARRAQGPPRLAKFKLLQSLSSSTKLCSRDWWAVTALYMSLSLTSTLGLDFNFM